MRERRWRPFSTSCREPVAQSVEHRPFKARALGSSPSRLTIYSSAASSFLRDLRRPATTLRCGNIKAAYYIESLSRLIEKPPVLCGLPSTMWSICLVVTHPLGRNVAPPSYTLLPRGDRGSVSGAERPDLVRFLSITDARAFSDWRAGVVT